MWAYVNLIRPLYLYLRFFMWSTTILASTQSLIAALRELAGLCFRWLLVVYKQAHHALRRLRDSQPPLEFNSHVLLWQPPTAPAF